MAFYSKRKNGRFLALRSFLLFLIFFISVLNTFVRADTKEDPMLPIVSEKAAPAETVRLERKETGEREEMSFHDYIIGVVAAEMPAGFESEALKAQAVIARTYALNKLNGEGEETALCDDPGHCQAFYDIDQLRKEWGDDFDADYERVKKAVEATEAIVLTYNGELAHTYYHAVCGGHTASAKEVWGEDIPYLEGVSCQWDRDAPRYCETVSVPMEKLYALAEDPRIPCGVSGSENAAETVPVIAEVTESGRVAALSVNGADIAGKDFRESLALNSTRFSIERQGDLLVITCVGFGHGVGLCQYGANGLAKAGKDFREILSYYYPGTETANI